MYLVPHTCLLLSTVEILYSMCPDAVDITTVISRIAQAFPGILQINLSHVCVHGI